MLFFVKSFIIYKYLQKNTMKKDKARHKPRGKWEDMSRAMSWLLRHGAVQSGYKIDEAGYISLEQLYDYLGKKGYKNINFDIIREVVDTNDKKRYQLQNRGQSWFIRATQGHSIKAVDTQKLLQLIEDPYQYPVVIHGTYMKFWDSIRKQGLKRMTRNHIHFAPGMPKEKQVISGMRGSCDIIIQIDLFSAMKDGIKFYVSGNNVILTEGVDGVLPPKYFVKVTTKKGQIIMGKQEQEGMKQKE